MVCRSGILRQGIQYHSLLPGSSLQWRHLQYLFDVQRSDEGEEQYMPVYYRTYLSKSQIVNVKTPAQVKQLQRSSTLHQGYLELVKCLDEMIPQLETHHIIHWLVKGKVAKHKLQSCRIDKWSQRKRQAECLQTQVARRFIRLTSLSLLTSSIKSVWG